MWKLFALLSGILASFSIIARKYNLQNNNINLKEYFFLFNLGVIITLIIGLLTLYNTTNINAKNLISNKKNIGIILAGILLIVAINCGTYSIWVSKIPAYPVSIFFATNILLTLLLGIYILNNQLSFIKIIGIMSVLLGGLLITYA